MALAKLNWALPASSALGLKTVTHLWLLVLEYNGPNANQWEKKNEEMLVLALFCKGIPHKLKNHGKNGGCRYCPKVRNRVVNIENHPKWDKFHQGSHYISIRTDFCNFYILVQ